MDKNIEQTTSIHIDLGLNKEKMPVDIKWKTSDAPANYPAQDAKAFFLSFFDRASRDTMKMDLWTTDMQVEEMDRFIFFTLRSLGDTYFRATNNKELAEQMQSFVQYFGEKTKIIPPK